MLIVDMFGKDRKYVYRSKKKKKKKKHAFVTTPMITNHLPLKFINDNSLCQGLNPHLGVPEALGNLDVMHRHLEQVEWKMH